jgi:excisionase family DNA binding protein
MIDPRTDYKISLVQAAPYVGVSPYTLRAWVRRRKIPFYRCGRRIVFSQADLDRFMTDCRVIPQEPLLR